LQDQYKVRIRKKILVDSTGKIFRIIIQVITDLVTLITNFYVFFNLSIIRPVNHGKVNLFDYSMNTFPPRTIQGNSNGRLR